MGRVGYLAVFFGVCLGHWMLLHTHVKRKPIIAQPQAKVYHITLSRVVLKKPPPPMIPPEPQIETISIPNIAPLPKPEPKPKPLHKKKRKNSRPKKRLKKVHVPKSPPPPKKVASKTLLQPPAASSAPPKQQIQAPIKQIQTTTLRDHYIAKIREEIRKTLYYPKIAKRMRIQGIVKVAFVVQKDGSVHNIKLLQSPRKILAKGAVRTIKALSLPPIPSELGVGQMDISVPIEFKLTKG